MSITFLRIRDANCELNVNHHYTFSISQTSSSSANANLTKKHLKISPPSDKIYCILTGTAPLNHWYVQPHYCQLLLSIERWLTPSTSTLPQNVWLLGPRIFPPLFAPLPTGRAVSALTLRQTWPSACWHNLPLRPELARWTDVDAGPRNTASLKIQTSH